MIENYLEMALTQMEHPCFIKNLDSKYLYINPKAAALANLKPSDFITKNDFEIFGNETGRKYREKDLAVINGQKIDPFDTFTDASGITRNYFIIRNLILDKEGKPCGIFGIRVDLTEYFQTQDKH